MVQYLQSSIQISVCLNNYSNNTFKFSFWRKNLEEKTYILVTLHVKRFGYYLFMLSIRHPSFYEDSFLPIYHLSRTLTRGS